MSCQATAEANSSLPVFFFTSSSDRGTNKIIPSRNDRFLLFGVTIRRMASIRIPRNSVSYNSTPNSASFLDAICTVTMPPLWIGSIPLNPVFSAVGLGSFFLEDTPVNPSFLLLSSSSSSSSWRLW